MDVDTGPAEAMDVEKTEHVESSPTVVDLIVQIARGLGVYDKPTLLSVLIERTLKELRFLLGAKVLESLVTNPKEVASCMQTAFANQRSGSVDEVAVWIGDMAASTKKRRARGQTAISGSPELMPATVLEDEEENYPRLRFEWKWARLPSLAEIEDRLRKRIGANLKFVKANIKL